MDVILSCENSFPQLLKNRHIVHLFLILQFLLLSFSLAQPQSSEAQKRWSCEEQISALSASFGGAIGVAAIDLKTGNRIETNGDTLFPTASVIKLPILVELFYRFHAGTLQRDQPVVLSDSNKWGGSGVLQYFAGTSQQKLIDAARMMIIVSDNTGTNMVLDSFANEHEAKLAAVNDRMRKLGLKNTVLQNKLMSYATKKKTPLALRYGVGYSTPNDMIFLLSQIARGEILGRAECDEMLEIMKNNTDESMAVRYLPFDQLRQDEKIEIAHKTGSYDDVKVDVGIIFGPKSTYAFAIFTDLSKDRRYNVDNAAVLTIARASRILYDYFQQ